MSPCHDISGKVVTNKVQALKNIAKLKLDRPKEDGNDLALETQDTIEVYWKIGHIPTKEEDPRSKVRAAGHLCDLCYKYLLLKTNWDRQSEEAIKSRNDFKQAVPT